MKSFPALLALVFALSAQAAEQRRFGDAGTLVPSGSMTMSRQPEFDLTEIAVQPSLQYFVMRNLALGLGVSYLRSSTPDVTLNGYAIIPSVGYNLRLGEHVSVFPQLFFSASHATVSGGIGLDDVFALGAFAPVLFHAAPHFFVGIGPQWSTGGTSSDLLAFQRLGLQTVIGGWL